jgi:ribosomal protein L11 methyltransferase
VHASDEDVASALLYEQGTLGIQVGSDECVPGHLCLLAYFSAGAVSLASLGACFETLPRARIAEAPVPQVDWVARFREGFRAFDAGAFRVVPAWEAGQTDDRTLIVDPGRAFGTGTHESTRLALAALEGVSRERDLGRVLDVGCGTGILGIAAARLGARLVVSVDVDQDAVASAALHARLNRVDLRVVLGDGCKPFAKDAFDVVLANLAAAPLLSLREEFVDALHAPGSLVLSGLLSSDLDEVLPSYGGLGTPSVSADGDWAAVVLRFPPSPPTPVS